MVCLFVCLSVTLVCLSVNCMYCLELIKFAVSNTSYCVEAENVALLRDVERSWKMILRSRGKFLAKKCGNPVLKLGCRYICGYYGNILSADIYNYTYLCR